MGVTKLAMQKGFDSEPVFKTEKHLKIKIKLYDGKLNTNFMITVFLKKVVTVFVYQYH